MFKFYWILLMCLISTNITRAASIPDPTQPESIQNIIKIDSLAYLDQLLSELNEDTLVIFDRDDTLFQVSCPMSREQDEQLDVLWLSIFNHPNAADSTYRNEVLQKIATHRPILIESASPDIIQRLQATGAKVIMATAACHGENPIGFLIEDMCIDMLKEVNIDFSNAFAEHSGTELTALNKNGYSPLYKNGILFCDVSTKGETIQAFFKLVNWLPKRIIFVDDNIKFQNHVQEAALELRIPFCGLHYHGAAQLPVPDLTEHCYRICYFLPRDFDE